MSIPIPEHVRTAAARVPTTLDHGLVEQALALYDAGYPPLEIAERLTVGRSTVLYWRRRSGLPVNGTRGGIPRLPADETARTVELYEQDRLTVEQIADRLGRGYSSVHKRLELAGVKLRRRGSQPGTQRATVPDGYVTSREASERLGVAREHVLRQAGAGRIPGAIRVPSSIPNGPRQVWAIPRQYVEQRPVRLVKGRLREENAADPTGPVRLVKGRQDRRLPAGPLVEWVQRQPQDESTLAELSGVPQRRLYAIREGEQDTVTLWTADRLLTANGARLEDVWPDIDELLAA